MMMMQQHHVEALLDRGYKIASGVEETSTCLIFTGIFQRDATRVKLKVLLNNGLLSFPSLPRSLSNFQHEHRIVEQLREVEGVVKIHERFSVANVEVLVLEDFGGEPLDEWLRRDGPFVERLSQFIGLAIEITKTLSQVHAHNIVHKNIQVKPFNCLFF